MYLKQHGHFATNGFVFPLFRQMLQNTEKSTLNLWIVVNRIKCKRFLNSKPITRRRYIHTFIYERSFLALFRFQTIHQNIPHWRHKMHTQVHLKLLIMMEIQSITTVVSIRKSITRLTHLIDHSYCQAWSALLAAAILKMHLYFYIATVPTSCDVTIQDGGVTRCRQLPTLVDNT